MGNVKMSQGYVLKRPFSDNGNRLAHEKTLSAGNVCDIVHERGGASGTPNCRASYGRLRNSVTVGRGARGCGRHSSAAYRERAAVSPYGRGTDVYTSRRFAQQNAILNTACGVETTCRGGPWERRTGNGRRYLPTGEGKMCIQAGVLRSKTPFSTPLAVLRPFRGKGGGTLRKTL
jgi:hypothetical protein